MMIESSTGRSPAEHRIRVNGVELAYFEWGAEIRGELPSILMVHATGFHARVWDQVIHRLGPRHVISVDQRGHGRSEKVPITDWRPMGRDLSELVAELGLENAIGVGHSMGGHAITEAAAARPGAFERLVLIDPVIVSPDDYGAGGWKLDLSGDEPHPTAKRKNEFASVQAMIDRFKDRAPYSRFDPAALRDYCEFGLLPAATGSGFTLACPPQIEASIYMTSRSNPGVYDSIRMLDIPVMILRAKRPPPDRDVMDFSSSPTWPGLVGEFRHGKEIYLPENSHFLPMEAPDLVARYVLEYEPGA
ncbi:MAG: alpha/beta hydrolase [Deltaproteobacteria bacterium]|nr:alpha/beta hydrolase [Deltaproteobacteria bacterium]